MPLRERHPSSTISGSFDAQPVAHALANHLPILAFSIRTEGMAMTEKKGHGSETAKKSNAKAAKEGKSNPRSSSAAQAELGKEGGKSK